MSRVESSCEAKGSGGRAEFRRGGIVVAVGLWLLGNSLHIGGMHHRNSWPLLMVLIGVVMAIAPAGRRGRMGGVMLIAWGGLCAIAVNELWGFGWFNIWPLFLVAGGIDLVANAIVEQRRPGLDSSAAGSEEIEPGEDIRA